MSSSSLFAAAFAIFGISSRMLVFAMGWDNSVATQLYFLFLLLAVFFGIRAFFISKPESNFVQLFKVGARSSALYSLAVTGFTYIFYKFFDPNYFLGQIATRLDEAQSKGYSAEEIERFTANMEIVFSLSTHIPTTLIGFTLLGMSYSVIVAFIFRKVPMMRKA
ncbi:MAG: hypothetical protein CL842_11840 [Crocinitomicaceae bacterium]|nr:hypothetical protein [Crocinitomicaceae bacterium]|tara:strand:+ start:8802 stop:9293 length:492 start_codon:yes stop_codon:yes gene_type:complete